MDLSEFVTAAVLALLPVDTPTIPIVLDDFETGRSPVRGMIVSEVGRLSCDNLTGESRALCGADTKAHGERGAVLSYTIDFDAVETVHFKLAARSDRDRFDAIGRPHADAFRVRATAGAASVVLAEFTSGSGRDKYSFVSTRAGRSAKRGILADGSFDTVILHDVSRGLSGIGRLDFEFLTTGSAEQIGIDDIVIEVRAEQPAEAPASPAPKRR